MKKKILTYVFLTALGLALLGAGIVSAHGWFGGFGGFSNLTPDQIATQQQTMFQEQAQILGISIDEVKDAWAEGKSFGQIIEEKGINRDEVQARMKDLKIQQMKSQLQILVDKGIITQSQADKRLQVMQDQLQNGKGRMMGKRFHRGFYRGFPF